MGMLTQLRVICKALCSACNQITHIPGSKEEKGKLLTAQGHLALLFFLIKAVGWQNRRSRQYDDIKTCHLRAPRDHFKYEVFQIILLKRIEIV